MLAKPGFAGKYSELRKHYYLDEPAIADGARELHTEYCIRLPLVQNRFFLGEFESGADALATARTAYPNVIDRWFCSTSTPL
jgi:hypothetical protein